MAILFDASTDRLSRTLYLPPPTNFTMMAWTQLISDRNTDGGLFGYSSGSAGCTVDVDGTGTQLVIYNGNLNSSGFPMVIGKWYHVAWTFDGVTHRLYVDGVQKDTNSHNTTPTTTLSFGADSFSEWSNQAIAAMKVWNTVLTPAEIRREMRQYVPVRRNALNTFTPGRNAADTRNFASTPPWTTGGTLTTSLSNPPIPWVLLDFTRFNIPAAAVPGGTRPVKMAGIWGGFAGASGGFVS